MINKLFTCPSCGFKIFEEGPGSFDICEICNWEDDNVQLEYPGMEGGANDYCLYESQDRILKVLPIEITEHMGYQRDTNWRPQDLKVKTFSHL